MRPVHYPLIPLLAWQAVSTARRAVRLPEPEGTRSGTLGSGPPLRLLIVGDSSAAGVGVDRQEDALSGRITARLARHARVHWQLEAKTGDTTGQTLARVRAADLQSCDIAVTGLGVNDVTHRVSKRRFLDNSLALHDHLRGLGAKRIYVSAFPPVGKFPLLPMPLRRVLAAEAEEYDTALARIIDRTDDLVRITPGGFVMTEHHMSSDGFHPGAIVYDAWAQRVAVAVLKDRHLLLRQPTDDVGPMNGDMVQTKRAQALRPAP